MQTRPDVTAEVGWRPFQLNPEMPRAGMSREAYLSAKFGGAERASRIYETIRTAGAELGIPFRFDLIRRTPSTLDSHRLVRWATAEGVQDRVVEALFIAYFTEGADVGDLEVLERIAVENGMDQKTTRDRLQNDVDLDLVRQEDAMARSMGINGVPCFIIDRKYAISGAQDVPVFQKVFDLAMNETVPVPEMSDAD